MKTILINVVTSIVTSLITVLIVLRMLFNHPIPLPSHTLPDGDLERPTLDLLSGKTSHEVFDQHGVKKYTLVTFRDVPSGTSVLYMYDKWGLSREDVFTTPVSGVQSCKVYKPGSLEPVCSYLQTFNSQIGPQKQYFDADGKEISLAAFQAIRDVH